MNQKKSINIAEAACLAGVAASTVRLWEKQGLITPDRSEKGHRRYDADQLTRLKRIASLRRDSRINIAAIREKLEVGGASPKAAKPRDATDATPEMTKLEQLEDENARLKRRVRTLERKVSAVREILEVEESSPEAGTPGEASNAISE
ncbi:MerR family transcriptional regulator [Rhizobium leguminosarum]|uniref:MerR family transcriptional regulator n=1 Tax=Rhizobium leguminosarum TaxID=384 RepID=UPI001441C08C|nr:MerR family transcriptional regulator [Rhizobium leguminosarum]MBY5827347.1 MerR family transcriptional regulator [Rhizobium leguminosarum]NKK80545.1 MerR family transcriptional regulator [Rhizobium leguminosarum bv. viciae]